MNSPTVIISNILRTLANHFVVFVFRRNHVRDEVRNQFFHYSRSTISSPCLRLEVIKSLSIDSSLVAQVVDITKPVVY